MTLVWDDAFAIGIPTIDSQHRELFKRVGQLVEALMAGSADHEVYRILAFLKEYTITHFRDEEELMAKHGYALLELHRAEHQALIRQLADWTHPGGEAGLRLTLDITHSLSQWLRTHIIRNDRAFAETIFGLRKAA
jgi:hemerythrin